MINEDFSFIRIIEPYPIWIIDNFLDKEIINEVNRDWVSQDTGLWGSGYEKVDGKKNILEHGMRWLNDYELMPESISKVIKHFHSDEFTQEIGKITDIDNLVVDESRNWSGMRVMLPNSYQLIHSDARSHPNKDGLRKELTCLMYFNEDYDRERDEGCLEIWNDDVSKREYEIEPINNRFVVFQNSDTSYHGVPLVNSERKSITFSILTNDDVSNRTKALFVPREGDSDEVKEMARKRLEV